MKVFSLILIILFSVAGQSNSAEVISLADEITVPVPVGWRLSTDSVEYPFQIVENELGAEVLIFKSIISSEEAIHSPDALRESVSSIAENVIPNLPESQLLSSTGLYENSRAIFILEFLSLDTLLQTELRQRMAGILYRHPDGHQILFTLWGKSPTELYGIYQNDIEMIQADFAYSGVVEDDVFGDSTTISWRSLIIPVVIIGLILFFRRFRARHSQVEFTEEISFWRCSCGRLNHLDRETCRRCGRQNVAEKTT